jgi:hypothetical protein
MDRDSLIARAEAQGVTRARILTRPELIDELLVKTSDPDDGATQRARGFFGRARDLLARIIERGLHLPDAADVVRASKSVAPPPRSSAQPLPTMTLAEIYAAQGHRDRAIETLRNVLEGEPEHAAARAMLHQLEAADYRGPAAPVLPPEEEAEREGRDDKGSKVDGPSSRMDAKPEPLGMLDDAPLPPKYDVDECVAIPVDPTTLFVYWEVRDRTREHLERTRAGGLVALRILVIVPSWDGPRTMVRDQDVGVSLGDWFIRNLPIGSVVRAAIGWRVGDVFIPIAHSPALETPPGEASHALADTLVRWTPRGAFVVTPADRDAASIERALGWARVQAARARALGSSELSLGSHR